jgi:hypothetical protein
MRERGPNLASDAATTQDAVANLPVMGAIPAKCFPPLLPRKFSLGGPERNFRSIYCGTLLGSYAVVSQAVLREAKERYRGDIDWFAEHRRFELARALSKSAKAIALVKVNRSIAGDFWHQSPCECPVNHTANARNWRARRDSNS